MYAIDGVRHFELGNPLVVVISALDSHFSYFGDFTKFYLNPLVYIICSRGPSTCLTTTAGFVESGIGRSMVNVPLQSFNPSISQTLNHSINQSSNQSINQSTIHLISHSLSQSVSTSIINQAINQMVSQSAT